MYEASQSWSDRAIHAALNGKLDGQYISYLQQFMSGNAVSKAPQIEPVAPLARQQSNIVLFRQESEMSLLIDEDRDEALPVPLKSSNNYTTLPLITRNNSEREKSDKHPIFPVPNHPPVLPHQTQAEPFDLNDDLSSARSSGRIPSGLGRAQQDTVMPLDPKVRNQIAGQQPNGKGRKSPTPKGNKDHGDEISHLTDEEIAYTPMSNSKQRPKSAVSKLGGYDNRSVGSAIPADETKKKLTLTKDFSTTSDSSRSRGPNPVTPSSIMTRNLAEFELPSFSDSQINSLESLEAFQESLNKHLEMINRERHRLDHLKLILKEQTQLENKAQKAKKIQEIQQKKRLETQLASEMEFERCCISNERIGGIAFLFLPHTSRLLRDHPTSPKSLLAFFWKVSLLTRYLFRRNDRGCQA